MTSKVVESRVDWLTATSDHEHKANELLYAGMEVIHRRGNIADPVRDWYWQGYRGASIPGCSAGWRVDGSCVRMSGEVAGGEWRELVSLAGRVSRLDVAVTCTVDGSLSDLADHAYRASLQHRAGPGRKVESTHIRNSKGGSTAYIGRRISERFLRCYNKHVESKGLYPKGTWRYEVEFKRDLASAAAELLAQAADVTREVQRCVESEFTRAGIFLPWDVDAESHPVISYRREPSTKERQLAWLQSSISPLVERLSTVAREEEILRALGVWYTTTKPVAVGTEQLS